MHGGMKKMDVSLKFMINLNIIYLLVDG